jgi:oxygen-independent coproporphyrinogen-3 oxidase
VRRADNDLEADMYEATLDRLASAGFEQYEISNFARPGARCRHNLVYWRNEPCLGIGPSAAGLVGELRYRNVPDTAAWARAVRAGERPWVEDETLDPLARARETMMLWLRLIEGVDRAAFAQRFGADPAELFAGAIEKHAAEGLLELTAGRIRLTRRGLLLADTVIADFL